MKILIVEDDQNKMREIDKFLKSNFPKVSIVEKKSYQSGLKEILFKNYDLVILDMSMPTFDQSPSESGGKILKYGGMEILRKISKKNNLTPCIVVTQFDIFGEGLSMKTLKELEKELEENFKKNYKGTVSYNQILDTWKINLKDKILSLNLE